MSTGTCVARGRGALRSWLRTMRRVVRRRRRAAALDRKQRRDRAEASRHEAAATRLRTAAARTESRARSWQKGADGERRVAELTTVLVEQGWHGFHDRRLGVGRTANIDHILVGPQGVFVVDAKNWNGAVISVDAAGRLYRDRRSKTEELNKAADQAASVSSVLSAAGLNLPVTAALCLVGDATVVTTSVPVRRQRDGGRRPAGVARRRAGPAHRGRGRTSG